MIYDAGAGALSGLTLNGLDIAPGSGSVQAIESGALAGAFRLRDEAGPEFQQRIDGFAEDLIDRLAAPGIDPTTGLGDPGIVHGQRLGRHGSGSAGHSGTDRSKRSCHARDRRRLAFARWSRFGCPGEHWG